MLSIRSEMIGDAKVEANLQEQIERLRLRVDRVERRLDIADSPRFRSRQGSRGWAASADRDTGVSSRGVSGRYPSTAARFAAASSAEATPPCAADHATGSSRNFRTSDSAASEK